MMAGQQAAADNDPEEIGKWITETTTQRLRAEADLRQATSKTTLTRQQIQALIEECADIATDLHHAEPADIAATYHKLGLRLTYHPEKQLIRAAACPRPTNIGKRSVSEGGIEHVFVGPTYMVGVHAVDHAVFDGEVSTRSWARQTA